MMFRNENQLYLGVMFVSCNYHVLVTRYVSQQRRELLLGQQTQHGDVERHDCLN